MLMYSHCINTGKTNEKIWLVFLSRTAVFIIIKYIYIAQDWEKLQMRYAVPSKQKQMHTVLCCHTEILRLFPE